MSPEEALAEAVTLIETAQRVIGGDWENIDVGALQCGLRSGGPGTTQAASRIGPGIPAAEQKAVLETITKKWTDAGYPPVQSGRPVVKGIQVTRLVYPATSGTTDDGFFVEVQVATTASTVDSRARCIPGNPGDISRGDTSRGPRPD